MIDFQLVRQITSFSFQKSIFMLLSLYKLNYKDLPCQAHCEDQINYIWESA